MNLPKDWSKKPDWLDKAREPSAGGKVALWAIAILVLLVGGATLVVTGLFF